MAQESCKQSPGTEDMARQPPNGPVLCSNGCGFFGNSETTDLCSKCFRDKALKQETKLSFPIDRKPSAILKSTDHVEAITSVRAASPVDQLPSTSPAVNEMEVGGDEPKRPQPSRCAVCRKKVGLTGFKCRCEGLFCSLHRYSDKHECNFDYKTVGREAISKANPVVVGEKLAKV